MCCCYALLRASSLELPPQSLTLSLRLPRHELFQFLRAVQRLSGGNKADEPTSLGQFEAPGSYLCLQFFWKDFDLAWKLDPTDSKHVFTAERSTLATLPLLSVTPRGDIWQGPSPSDCIDTDVKVRPNAGLVWTKNAYTATQAKEENKTGTCRSASVLSERTQDAAPICGCTFLVSI